MKPRTANSFPITCCLITCVLAKCQGASFPSPEEVAAIKDISDFAKKEDRIYTDDNRRWKSTAKDKFELSEGMIFREEKISDRDRLDTEDRKWSNESVDFEGNKCSRYCIRKTKDNEDESGLRINLFLSFADDIIGTENYTTEKESKFEIIENDLVSDQKCQIYLDVDCQLSDTRKHFHPHEDMLISQDNYNNNVLDSTVTLVEKTEGRGYSEVNFHVDDWMSTMYAYVQGNLSEIVFGIPDKDQTLMGMDFKMSLRRLKDSQWLVIEGRNPPPGRWGLKLVGEGDLSYRFAVIAGIVDGEELEDDGVSSDDFVDAESTISEMAARERGQFGKHEKLADKLVALDDVEIVDLQLVGLQQLPRKLYGSDGSKNIAEKLTADRNLSIEESSFSLHDHQQDRQISTLEKDHNDVNPKSLKQIDLDPNMMNYSTDGNVSLRMIELVNDSELAELDDFRGFSDVDNALRRKKIRINVNINSKLIISSDLASNQNIHRIFFDVKNNQAVTVRCDVRASSSPLRIFNVIPQEMWLAPGETKGVAVDIELPRGIVQENINTVTLFVKHAEIIEKEAYLYIQTPNSKIITDDTKPTIDYTFNGNCNGKLHRDGCSKYFWGVDIKITDSESGLKYVSASPNDLYEQTDFVSGTKNPVMFYYSANCCSTTVKVTAIDLLNNENTRTIDVTAWDNLSEAEIAVIVVGALLVLLLIVLVILIIIYCVRKKKSLDLPYSQRYGSRPPARTEGTSF